MTQASINNLNEQVQQYSLLIANKQAELEASQAEEQRLNEQYKTRIRSMEETGNISYWAILFGANSFSDLLDKIDVIQEIAKADQTPTGGSSGGYWTMGETLIQRCRVREEGFRIVNLCGQGR